MKIHKINGDGTGLIEIDSPVTVKIAEELDRTHVLSHVRINQNGQLVTAPTVIVYEEFDILGQLYGMQDVTVRGNMRLKPTGLTACKEDVCSGEFYSKSHFWFASLTITSDGLLQTYNSDARYIPNGIHIHSEKFEMEGDSEFQVVGTARVTSSESELEKNVEVTGEYYGWPASAGTGAGAQCGDDSYKGGSGAGHGGHGGSAQGCSHRGEEYDQWCLPQAVGSGGGGCYNGKSGGAGGAAIQFIAGSVIRFEANIEMDGEAGNTGAGGGSGGSVWMDADYLEGWGSMSCDGGAAYNSNCLESCWLSGCCKRCNPGTGSGGRIRTYPYTYGNKVLIYQRSVIAGGGSANAAEPGTLCSYGNNLCSGNGEWDEDQQLCVCNDDYSGNDCQYNCDATTTCNNHGTCSTSGGCDCHPGWVGYHCEHQCNPETTCNGHGYCSHTGLCVCDSCFGGDTCTSECSGNGYCQGGVCVCDSCSLGDYCGSECNEHGSCGVDVSGNKTCTCEESWRGDKCTQPGCPGTQEDCSGNGYCNSATHTCYCHPGWMGKPIWLTV